jgi:hypothetical protein
VLGAFVLGEFSRSYSSAIMECVIFRSLPVRYIRQISRLDKFFC